MVIDRRGKIRDAKDGREKFLVEPALIPDFLALIGDTADGYPGISGIGASTTAQLLNRYGVIEEFPQTVLGERRELALLFKHFAMLRIDAPLLRNVDALRWRGATSALASYTERMEPPRVLERCLKAPNGLKAKLTDSKFASRPKGRRLLVHKRTQWMDRK